jgi:hypothetical protein
VRKFTTTYTDDQTPRGWSWLRIAATILLGLAVSPLVYDGARVCVGQWRGMRGENPYVETPVFDAVGAGFEAVRLAWHNSVEVVFYNLPWRPEYVMGIAAAWAIGGSFLLRSRWR